MVYLNLVGAYFSGGLSLLNQTALCLCPPAKTQGCPPLAIFLLRLPASLHFLPENPDKAAGVQKVFCYLHLSLVKPQ
jgi:hypothetical protein